MRAEDIDELRPLTAVRLLELWRRCREETEDPLEVVVSFPGVEGIPAGFEQTKARIEEILPCHLLVKYQFSDSV